jgi:hypothetical protein
VDSARERTEDKAGRNIGRLQLNVIVSLCRLRRMCSIRVWLEHI